MLQVWQKILGQNLSSQRNTKKELHLEFECSMTLVSINKSKKITRMIGGTIILLFAFPQFSFCTDGKILNVTNYDILSKCLLATISIKINVDDQNIKKITRRMIFDDLTSNCNFVQLIEFDKFD